MLKAPTALEPDIVQKIEQTFSSSDAQKAIDLISAAGISGRIARCVVFAARGNIDVLKDYLQRADLDYREVIIAGEYVNLLRQRDFRVSFLIDEPAKMWISEIAAALAPRDYFLSEIVTVPARKHGGKAAYFGKLGEGTATFEGDMGKIVVTKDHGHWTLACENPDFAAHDLAKPFKNEKEFAEAISSYILTKRISNQ